MIVIVIATYNEADNIEKLLKQLTNYKVIVVDDSSDDTAEIAESFPNVDVIKRIGKQGIASAYKRGFWEAFKYNPKYVIQMDAGLTHNPDTIPQMISLADTFDLDLVIGSRFLWRTKIKSYRTAISLIGAALMRFINIHVKDATSGFRCWRSSLLYEVVNRYWLSKGFAFQLETLHQAYKISGNNKISEVGIEYKLTNSSFNFKILMEALWIYSILLFY